MTPRRHGLIRGPSQERLSQRLYRELAGHVADRLGCCPVHGTRLICPLCDTTWKGTAAEEEEIEGLVERAGLTGYQATSPWHCNRCRAEAMCVTCYNAGDEPADAGLIAEEQARFQELLVHLVPHTEGRPDH